MAKVEQPNIGPPPHPLYWRAQNALTARIHSLREWGMRARAWKTLVGFAAAASIVVGTVLVIAHSPVLTVAALVYTALHSTVLKFAAASTVSYILLTGAVWAMDKDSSWFDEVRRDNARDSTKPPRGIKGTAAPRT
jgi:hypothetical protein